MLGCYRQIVVGLFLGSAAASTSCLPDTLLFGTTSWIPKYENICCTSPQPYAERSGFLYEPAVRLFDRLREIEEAVLNGADPSSLGASFGAESLIGIHAMKTDEDSVEFVFYDSQCGLPLFVAPRRRSLQDFRVESLNHGWPSFREPEILEGSISHRLGGEVVSSCPAQPTHLGHKFVDSFGPRYCIDLICIAGQAHSNFTSSESLQSYITSADALPSGGSVSRGPGKVLNNMFCTFALMLALALASLGA